jgi:hypothetical protein
VSDAVKGTIENEFWKAAKPLLMSVVHRSKAGAEPQLMGSELGALQKIVVRNKGRQSRFSSNH